uniref:Uncharacterized protein n=1 Tax=Megaselia scalaris TaxID=36166 RepID=T1GMW9_MEGSC
MLSISLSKGSSWEQLFSEDSKSPTSKKPRPKCTKPAISISVQASTPFSQNGNIMTLPKSDSSLYGFFPEIEPFALCVCSICNLTLKPQGLLKHMMKRHGRRVKENKINGSIQLAKPAKLLKNIKLKTSNIESSSSTSSSSNVNSDEEVISANVLTPITSKSNVNLSAPVEIEPTMSPLSEILKQIEDGSNDVPEITDCSSSSDHFKEVQKIIKSFEDVERSQVNYNDETFSKEEKERQTKMLTEILSKQEKFESNDLQAFNLLLNRSATKQDKLNLLNGSDHLVFMFIETDEQFQDLVFDRIGLCDAIKKVTENTLAADFPHPRAPDHEKKFKEVYQDLINTRHLLMVKSARG